MPNDTASSPLWYVEAFDRYDTHNGGFRDISEPFETEQVAREYAEIVHHNSVALYKAENNRFEHIDDYTRDDDERPTGWHKDVTEEIIVAHRQARIDAFQREQDALERSGKPIRFRIFREHSDFWHNDYPDRASAECEIEHIKTVRPTAEPTIGVLEDKPGVVWGRYYPYDTAKGAS